MLNDLQLQRLEDSIQNSDLSRDEISRLVGELEQSYRTLLTFDAKEQSYVTEIQRLNSVVMQLMEYVETIAEIAGDTTPGFRCIRGDQAARGGIDHQLGRSDERT